MGVSLWLQHPHKPALKSGWQDHCLGVRLWVRGITSFLLLGFPICWLGISKGLWLGHLEQIVLLCRKVGEKPISSSGNG